MQIGDVVISEKGRYDGQRFFVVEEKDGFVYLCDGKKRKIDRPKKKRITHVRETGESSIAVKERLCGNRNAIDALMRKELKRIGVL